MFTGTVRDNLTLAAPNADDAEIQAALQRVNAQHVVAGLNQGLDTPLGHGGHTLTAAEVQHLALARLVLANPTLVILDEATAEADSSDDDRLNHAGQIIEQGDHDSLVAAGGAYADLWAAWNQQDPYEPAT